MVLMIKDSISRGFSLVRSFMRERLEKICQSHDIATWRISPKCCPCKKHGNILAHYDLLR